MKLRAAITFILFWTLNSIKTMDNTQLLKTELQLERQVFQPGEEISVKFTVTNTSEQHHSFCKWQTPLEKDLTANIFEIVYKESRLRYMGKMVKRSTLTGDSITINSGESVSQSIIISNAYPMEKPGTYTIKYTGRPLNGLPDSPILQFTIE